MRQRRHIQIRGAVQGVGFRPFIFNLATRLGVTGWIANTSEGVTIEAQAAGPILDQFLQAITAERPRLARPEIAAVQSLAVESRETAFVIRASRREQTRRFAIAPDAATCPECLRELADPGNRRHRYAFINCTHCGPRYTILCEIPYDRANTTMRKFSMCPSCQAEYDDPADRRFHAQPNACGACGPRLWLTDERGRRLETDDPVARAIELLRAEHILAVKGLGGFHLAVRADSAPAVAALRQRKYRKAKAFAVMVRDIDAARRFADVDAAAAALLGGAEHPIVLCPKKPGHILCEAVAPASRFWGIMLAYSPLHALLMQGEFPALVMTSGNNTDEPIESDNAAALERLDGIADYFLLHDRDIFTSCDDSVAKIVRGRPLLLRRARGYVPLPIRFARRSDADILAVGAELKNTITYLKGPEAYVSQHIGDLKGTATYDSFRRTIETLGALIDCRPGLVACDLHPALLSSRFAGTYRDARLIAVQHHHAHIAAVMGEHDLAGPVAGIAADGLGYGTDDTIWGCELLAVWRDRFERAGFLEPVRQPGGDAASREPWRMAVSYLIAAFGPEQGPRLARSLLADTDPAALQAVADLCIQNIHCPLTSSLGRLFDAVSSLLGICQTNTYDAQGPIELENVVDPNVTDEYPLAWSEQAGRMVLRTGPLFAGLVDDRQSGRDRAVSAATFHNSLVTALAQGARRLADNLATDIVAVSGGAFQNHILLTGLIDRLEAAGLRVFCNERLPINDGCISFGQAVVADATAAG